MSLGFRLVTCLARTRVFRSVAKTIINTVVIANDNHRRVKTFKKKKKKKSMIFPVDLPCEPNRAIVCWKYNVHPRLPKTKYGSDE